MYGLPIVWVSHINLCELYGGVYSSVIVKWETEVEKTEAIIRQFEEASRTRTMNDAADGLEEVDPIIEEALLDIPIPRSLEALDLAGM